MADVTLSGNIDQAYSTTKINSTSKITDIGGSGASNALGETFVTFAGNEDIGGGLKASFKLEQQLTINSAAMGGNTREAYVGLTGGFGDVKVGTNYAPSFTLFAAGMDPNGVSQGSGNLGWGMGTNLIGAGNSSIIYTLPTLVSGLGVSVAKAQGGANAVGTTPGAGDTQQYALAYTMGAVTVGYAAASTKNTSLAYTTPGGVATLVQAAANGTTLKNTVTGLSYNAGVANISYVSAKNSLQGDSVSSNTYGISVPLGATTIGYTSSTAKAVDGATTSKFKGSEMVVSYALSKRTKAYFHNGSYSTSGALVQDKLSYQGVGIAHSF
jgi:predicted porin